MTNISRLCHSLGGKTLWNFSQLNFQVLRQLFFIKNARYGICAALSSYWIKHFKEGLPLKIVLRGNKKEGVNRNKLLEIANLYSVSGEGDFYYQEMKLTSWLRKNGVTPLQMKEEYPDNHFQNMEHVISTALLPLSNCFVKLNFGGKAFFSETGHAVAMHIGEGNNPNITYFDPNYGEFFFQHKEQFYNFFRSYYRAKYLTCLIRFNAHYQYMTYRRD